MIHLLFPRSNIVCSVHEAPDHPASVAQRAEDLVFLQDGFSWRVALLPPLALLTRGAWAPLAAYVALAVAVLAGLNALAAPEGWSLLALLVLSVVFGFEAASLQRWSMGTLGWTEVGVVSGADQDECERRFFDAWLTAQSPPAALAATTSDQPSMLRRLFAARP